MHLKILFFFTVFTVDVYEKLITDFCFYILEALYLALMVQKRLADLTFHVSEVVHSFTDFFISETSVYKPQISYLSNLQCEAHCASILVNSWQIYASFWRESKLTTFQNCLLPSLVYLAPLQFMYWCVVQIDSHVGQVARRMTDQSLAAAAPWAI